MMVNRALLCLLFIFGHVSVFASGYTFLSGVSHGLHIPEHVLTFSLIGLLFLVAGIVYRVKVNALSNSLIPDKGITFRNVVELFGQTMMSQCKTVIGEEEGPKYFKFVTSIFLVILLSNLIGLIPGFLPPTENLNTTLALGLISFAYYNIQGCRAMGTVNYLKHFMGPLWYMAILIFPIEIISNMVRPLSLALRLRGNMFGDHLVLGIFSGLAPYVVPIIFMILGILVSLIQAYVFSVLSMVYISLATAHHDHDEH